METLCAYGPFARAAISVLCVLCQFQRYATSGNMGSEPLSPVPRFRKGPRLGIEVDGPLLPLEGMIDAAVQLP